MTAPALAFGHPYVVDRLGITPAYFESMVDRFWEKVDTSSDCWEWQSATTASGYPVFHIQNNGQVGNVRAHRLAYWLTFGEFNEDLTIDHLCFNKACVNPHHLEPTTVQENLHRALVEHHPHKYVHNECRDGHPLVGDNLYLHPDGERRCRRCIRGAR